MLGACKCDVPAVVSLTTLSDTVAACRHDEHANVCRVINVLKLVLIFTYLSSCQFSAFLHLVLFSEQTSITLLNGVHQLADSKDTPWLFC